MYNYLYYIYSSYDVYMYMESLFRHRMECLQEFVQKRIYRHDNMAYRYCYNTRVYAYYTRINEV